MCNCLDKPLTTRELAARWHTTPGALATRRSEGKPMPKGFRIGKFWHYYLEDIQQFEQERMVGDG